MASVVVLDTSALMLPVELDVRIFDELERLFGSIDPVVTRPAMVELDHLAAGRGTAGRAASVGRKLVEQRCRVIESTTDVADDAALEVARTKPDAVLVTADRDLADRALEAAVPVVVPRGQRRLTMMRP